jgi:hypothetical protein
LTFFCSLSVQVYKRTVSFYYSTTIVPNRPLIFKVANLCRRLCAPFFIIYFLKEKMVEKNSITATQGVFEWDIKRSQRSSKSPKK